MKALSRWWLVCLVCSVMGLVPLASVARADEPVSLLGDPLLVPAVEPIVGGQQAMAEEAAGANPEAAAARVASASAYKSLSADAARSLVAKVFPKLIGEANGGPPRLSGGKKITGYLNPYTAELPLAENQHALVESSTPMALEAGSGRWQPVDLSIRETGGAFEPVAPLVAMEAPTAVNEGMELSSMGITVTPVEMGGSELQGSAGTVEGSTVFYANTQVDADTIFKPSSFGFAIDTILRSADSPEDLAFQIQLPAGAIMRLAHHESDRIQIVREGVTIASIPAPSAQDAAGKPVQVSDAVHGNILTLMVTREGGSVLYPVDVDPEVVIESETFEEANWHHVEASGGGFEYGGYLQIQKEGTFPRTNWAYWAMKTKGDSKIFAAEVSDELEPLEEYGFKEKMPFFEAWYAIYKEGAEFKKKTLTGSTIEKTAGVCANAECSESAGEPGNQTQFEITSLESSSEIVAKGLFSEPVYYGGSLPTETDYISQPKETHSTVSYSAAPEISYLSGGKPAKASNVFYGSNGWFGPEEAGVFEFESSDAGLGVLGTHIEVYKAGKWEVAGSRDYAGEGCIGIQCGAKQYEAVTYSMIGGYLTNGYDTVRVAAHDPMSGTWSSEHGEGEATLKVDSEKPYGITLSGLPAKGEEYSLGEIVGKLKVEASDGAGSTPSSGIKQITVGVDGKEVGKPAGFCTPGPCTTSGEWEPNGAELGTGSHVLTVVATDNAGNYLTKDFVLNVYQASPVAMGPGSVNPESGDFALESTDVSMSGGMGSLSVSRHYDSRNLAEGSESPFGPQWTISLASIASLEVLPDGSVMVIGPEGLTHFEKKTGGEYEAPSGDSGLTLELKGAEYILKNAAKGTTTDFTLPSGAEIWMATTSAGPIATDTTTAEYVTVEPEAGKKVIEPTLELAPHPAATCAREKMEKGCRGLEFEYGHTTTAKGEKETEWGDYNGRLKEVILIAYNPSSKGMEKRGVAQYEYDSQGRLRAEWNPSISPALRTTYGYDTQGHVTAISPPAQEPWIATYGTIPGDMNAGRLLSMTRPSAATTLGSGEAVADTAVPTLSTNEPEVNIRLTVSTGTWSGSPISYGYQWEDCNLAGGECVPIAGATNASYVPLLSDAYHTLVALVSATNRDGTKSVSTVASNAVPSLVYEREIGTAGEGEGQLKHPEGVAVDSKGHIWVADTQNNRIEEFTSSGAYMSKFGTVGSGNGQLSKPHDIVPDNKGDLYVSDTGNNRIEEFTEAGGYLRQFNKAGLLENLNAPTGVAIDNKSEVWAINPASTYGVLARFTPEGEYKDKFGSSGMLGTFKEPQGLAASGTEDLWIADTGNSRIQMCGTSTHVCEAFGSSGSGNGQFTSPADIAVDGSGDLWVADAGNNRVQELSPSRSYLQQLGIKGTGVKQLESPLGVALDSSGDLYVADTNNNRITKWAVPSSELSSPPEPPNTGTNSVSTIEYGVPMSGAGVPSMTSGDVSKWAQSDDPYQATAIFPPDEPMGWPAKDYKRATIYYFDSQARTVNVAAPNGAVATTEYNEEGDVVRTLSAANRATAVKEAKPEESAKLLDAESKYSLNGTELLETTGPQHTVKLASGSEVQGRSRTRYSYDEGAPAGESYDLVTKSVASVVVGGNEEEPRMTRTYYSGQKGLGWKLREPTSVVTDSTGLALTKTIVYNETTGDIVETKAPGGSTETVYPPVYSGVFGGEGTGSGQFKEPFGDAIGASGNVWVVDKGNHRVEKFSSTGSVLGTYGSEGSAADQFGEAWDVAVNRTTGNVYVTDSSDNRIEELNSSGAFVETIGWGVRDGKGELEVCTSSCRAGSAGSGEGQFNYPIGITIDATGNLWVADDGNNRVQEISEAGAFVSKFGSYGTGNGQFDELRGIAISEGDLYVIDRGNDRVEEFSPNGTYLNQFGSKGSGPGQFNEPFAIAVNPTSGNLFISDGGNNRTQEISPAGKFLAEWMAWSESHELEAPLGLAINATGELYMVNSESSKVSEWLPPEAGGAHLLYNTQFGTSGSGEGQFSGPSFSAIDGSGNVWVTDYSNNRIQKFSSAGKYLAKYGKEGTGEVQFKHPVGIAINQSTGNVYVADNGNNRIEELSSTGTYVKAFGTSGSGALSFPEGLTIDSSGNVWVADTHHERIVEFSSTGTYIAAYGTEGTGNGQFKDPADIAFSGSNLYVTDRGNHRVQELSTSGAYVRQFGTEGSGSGELYNPQGIGADSAGNLYVSDEAEGRVQEFSPTGTFRASFGSSGSGTGQLNKPIGVTIDSAGDMYVADSSNNRVEQWQNDKQAVHDTKTIYYTAKEEAEVSACQNHPEWAGLPCETEPAAQPETSGAPALPVALIEKYNIWDEAETLKETFGTTTRKKTTSFDSAGRAITSEVTSTIDTPVSAVTDKYDVKTGALVEESNIIGGKTKTIKSVFNTLGQLTAYTDADENTTKYEYEGEGTYTGAKELDGRLRHVADVKGGQTYTYDETSGYMTKLVDSAAGAFTTSRDVEGRITSETYPNAMTSAYTYNAAGEATGIKYEKTAHCATSCPETWFKETVASSGHGEALERANSLTTDKYAYDILGRLTETQETPVGKDCVTRLYGYDEESNRTSLTSRPGTSESKCPTEGGTTERHEYDAANRLMDSGVSYETFGNTTKLPGADAGGPEMEITTEYYDDNQVSSQTQNGETYKYSIDPAGRVRETESSGKTSAVTVSHYAGPGSALSWTSEPSSKWTRNIPGIDGALAAIQNSSGTVTLQLHDLQGNVVDTVTDNEAETKVATSYNSTEFGVPLNGTPPTKYSWLGAAGVSSEQASGLVTQDGVTYVPQTGRPLQTQGISPPTPDNEAIAYVSTIEVGIEGAEAAAASQQAFNAEQAKKALEAAHEEEGEEGGGGCSGMNACAASAPKGVLEYGEKGKNGYGCSVWGSWGAGEFLAGEIAAFGHWKCGAKAPGFEMQIEVYGEGAPAFEGYQVTMGTGHKITHFWHGKSNDNNEFQHTWKCPATGKWYHLWFWGRQLGTRGKTQWSASGWEGEIGSCVNQGPVDFSPVGEGAEES